MVAGESDDDRGRRIVVVVVVGLAMRPARIAALWGADAPTNPREAPHLIVAFIGEAPRGVKARKEEAERARISSAAAVDLAVVVEAVVVAGREMARAFALFFQCLLCARESTLSRER